MSFKSAIAKIKSKLMKQPTIDEQMAKYEKVLLELIDSSELINSSAEKGATCIYIYPAPGANIDTIQELYSDLGIKLKKHISHLGNRRRQVLYITLKDFMKMDKKLHDFVERTITKGRQIELSVRRSKTR